MILLAIIAVGAMVLLVGSRLAMQGAAQPANSAAVAPAPSAEPQPTQSSDDANTFHGYQCSPDCSQQVQGYSDAQNDNVKSREDCPEGPQVSDAYSQGCWAYADEQANGGNP